MQGSIAPHHQVAQGDDGTGLPCPDCPNAQHTSGFRPIGSHSAKAVPEVSLIRQQHAGLGQLCHFVPAM
jgi:hypothetical protein